MDDIATRAPRHAWGMAKVVGESMVPTLQAGDRLWISYRRTPEPGSVVVARLADGAVVVKRAVERRTTASGRPGWWLLSDNSGAPGVVDSRHRGPVADDDVIAVVVGRLWPRPHILR